MKPVTDLTGSIKKLRKFFFVHKRLPSYREMCELFGFASKNSIHNLVKRLITMGILDKDSGGKLIPKQLFPPIPLLGTIPAGSPRDAQEQILDTLSIEQYVAANPERSYLLRVSGDSMVGAGIFSGDFVVLEKDRIPNDGDVVVACIDHEFTLKYFRKDKTGVQLVAANHAYAPIRPQTSLHVFGVVVSVIRKYH